MKNLIISMLFFSVMITTSLFAGAPYITNSLSMAEMVKLTASDAAADDMFGGSVAIDGETAVVGAYNDNSGQGVAYVYQFNPLNGQYEQKAVLFSAIPEGNEKFGTSVAIDGNIIVVGAINGANYNGTVYLYEEPATGGWVTAGATAELNASDGDFTDHFGISVAVEGDTVVVGANQDDDNDENSGSVYIFTKPGASWSSKHEDFKLTASDGATSDAFGMSVDIDGDVIAVSALGADDGTNSNSGAAYVFVKPDSGWSSANNEDAKLTPSLSVAGNVYMGRSIAISGDTIVVGADSDDGGDVDSGSVYLFEKPSGEWSNNTQNAKLIASDGMIGDNFGISVSIDDDTIVVGDYEPNDNTDAGAVYFFKKPPGGWNDTVEDAKFTASDKAAADGYGHVVSISGDAIIIGALGNDDNGVDSGSAYIIKESIVTHIIENKTLAIDVDAADINTGDTISYSMIGDEDSSLLTINTLTGLINFKSAPDFENPVDTNHDNIYRTIVKVEDDAGNYTFNPLILPISNLEYEGETLSSQNLDEIQNISVGEDYDEFGYAVAVEGKFLVVGAPYNDVSGYNQGIFYLFEYNTATNRYDISAELGTVAVGEESFAGISVAISGDTIVIGASGTDDNGTDSGSVYIFEKPVGGWINGVRDAKLTASDAAAYDNFGTSVAVSGTTVIVGAPGDDNSAGIDAGSVYLFERPLGGWGDKTQDAKLTASDAAESDLFGHSVSFSGDTIVVGSYYNDAKGNNSGSAYLFEKSIWGWRSDTENVKFTASDAAIDDNFGISVSISGDTVLIGAEGDSDHLGSAYIFEKPQSGWRTNTEDAKLTPFATEAWKYFGHSVSISGETIVVGAYGDTTGGTDSGSAYIFEKPSSGWTNQNENTKLTASDAAEYNQFGHSVAISGDTVIVGAHYNHHATGSSYVFKEGSSIIMAPLIMYLLN